MCTLCRKQIAPHLASFFAVRMLLAQGFPLLHVQKFNLNVNPKKMEGVKISAEPILTLKNRELIHFSFLLRGFVAKESILDS